MGRGRKKSVDKPEVEIRKEEPAIDVEAFAEVKVDETDVIVNEPGSIKKVVHVEPAPARLSDCPPVYLVVKGAFSTNIGIIDKNTVAEGRNDPGQIRPEYVAGGVEALEKWVRLGKLTKR